VLAGHLEEERLVYRALGGCLQSGRRPCTSTDVRFAVALIPSPSDLCWLLGDRDNVRQSTAIACTFAALRSRLGPRVLNASYQQFAICRPGVEVDVVASRLAVCLNEPLPGVISPHLTGSLSRRGAQFAKLPNPLFPSTILHYLGTGLAPFKDCALGALRSK
jgi:hypothetical protein